MLPPSNFRYWIVAGGGLCCWALIPSGTYVLLFITILLVEFRHLLCHFVSVFSLLAQINAFCFSLRVVPDLSISIAYICAFLISIAHAQPFRRGAHVAAKTTPVSHIDYLFAYTYLHIYHKLFICRSVFLGENDVMNRVPLLMIRLACVLRRCMWQLMFLFLLSWDFL